MAFAIYSLFAALSSFHSSKAVPFSINKMKNNLGNANNQRAKVLTTVRLPICLYREIEAIKGRYGIPHTRTIQRGIELAIRELATELKNSGATLQA
jgi:hypothetical protein